MGMPRWLTGFGVVAVGFFRRFDGESAVSAFTLWRFGCFRCFSGQCR